MAAGRPTSTPVALSVSLNVKRRNLTKSQTAIAAAQTWIGSFFLPAGTCVSIQRPNSHRASTLSLGRRR